MTSPVQAEFLGQLQRREPVPVAEVDVHAAGAENGGDDGRAAGEHSCVQTSLAVLMK